ncbi:MAG: PAS domain-containing sensor histidine kinase [Gemmatimonadetes bacterium]|nr:PAS domain-containing sensor histidine kinase [Gemmatimonadota bacterium]
MNHDQHERSPAFPTASPAGRESAERMAAWKRGDEIARDPAAAAPRDPYRGQAPAQVADRAFAALAENVRDYAIFLMSPEGVITFWGEGARLIKWWSREEAEGAHLRMLYPDGGSEDGTAEEHLRQAAESGEYIGQGHRVRADTSTFWARVSLTALRDTDGKLLGFAKVTRDLTAKRAEEAALLMARHQAEAAIRLKSELLQDQERAHGEVEGATERLREERAERSRLEATRYVLLRQLIAAEEQERIRLSRELHDQLGQLVTALCLGLRGLRSGNGSAGAALEDLEQLAVQLSRELSHIASELRPPALDRLGLQQALQAYVEDWATRYGISAEFQPLGVGHERFALEVETTLFRTVQEALINVAKHSAAQNVSVILERKPGSVGVIVEDDGAGFDPAAVAATGARTRRIGLVGMCERVELLGGTLELESAPGAGTTLFIRLPTHDTGPPPNP